MRFARVSSALLFVAAAAGCTSDNDGPTGAPKLQQVAYFETHDVAVSGDLAQSATKYVRSNDLLTSSGDDWSVRATQDAGGMKHVRMHQMHGGVRVWGGDIVVHTQGSKYSSVAGNRVTDLQGFDIKATVADADALATAKQDYSLRTKDPKVTLKFDRMNTELVIFPQAAASTRLAWHTSFYTELQAGIEPALMHYMVDAKTGQILTKWNGIHTVFAQASGPGGNAKVAHPWVNQLDVQKDGATWKAETPRVKTSDMMNSTSGNGTVATGSLEAFGDAPINDAHGHAEQTLNMLDQWQGHNSIDDAGFQIVSRVHYGSNYENAFWDGAQMTYGDGQNYFYPLSGDIDVVAHEINHGFTTFHSDLTYSGESGGMNESFSDIAGAVAEHFDEGDGADFDVGADIFKEVGAALRYMCDPTADGASIDHYSDYAGQDVHYTSGIQNKAFCLAARRFTGDVDQEANAVAVRRLSTAFYKANASYWTASSTFAQGCQGVIDAARELAFTDVEIGQIRDSYIDVGVYCDGAVEPLICDDTFTTETGTVTSPNYPANYPDNFKRTYCIIPASGNPATVTFTAFNTEAGWDFVTVKDGETGEVLSTTSGTTPPPPATAKIVSIKFTSDVTITAPGWSASW
ncbi:MAG: M4 family metallopeptidase [Kofleriaceae bacterium]